MFKRKKTADQIVTLLAKDLREIAARGGSDAKVLQTIVAKAYSEHLCACLHDPRSAKMLPSELSRCARLSMER